MLNNNVCISFLVRDRLPEPDRHAFPYEVGCPGWKFLAIRTSMADKFKVQKEATCLHIHRVHIRFNCAKRALIWSLFELTTICHTLKRPRWRS